MPNSRQGDYRGQANEGTGRPNGSTDEGSAASKTASHENLPEGGGEEIP
jgi:hypothetical protein